MILLRGTEPLFIRPSASVYLTTSLAVGRLAGHWGWDWLAECPLSDWPVNSGTSSAWKPAGPGGLPVEVCLCPSVAKHMSGPRERCMLDLCWWGAVAHRAL